LEELPPIGWKPLIAYFVAFAPSVVMFVHLGLIPSTATAALALSAIGIWAVHRRYVWGLWMLAVVYGLWAAVMGATIKFAATVYGYDYHLLPRAAYGFGITGYAVAALAVGLGALLAIGNTVWKQREEEEKASRG